MPLDAITLQALVAELRPQLLGLRIDKVQQPARDQVILLLRGNRRLLLNAGANAPRLQLTELLRDNPAEPPMFCMLLRKHLVGARVAEITQPPMERLVRMELDITDEFGRPGRRTLVLEAMGRRSNLILLDGDGRIIECLRRVDADLSAARQVLPGLFYQAPASGDRLPVTQETEAGFRARLAAANPERQLDAFLLDQYFGLSPLTARELAFRTTGETDSHLFGLGPAGEDRFWQEVSALIEAVKENRFAPYCLWKDGRPVEFSAFAIRQYGSGMECVRCESFSQMLDRFYEVRERQERVRQKGADLIRTATTARDRLRRKLALQEKDYAQTQDRDQLRICGDLITANLYRMERGARTLTCENYYEEGCPQVTVPLDPLLTVTVNFTSGFDMDKYVSNFTASDFIVANAAKFQTGTLIFSDDMGVPQPAMDEIQAQGGNTGEGVVYGQTSQVLEYITENYFRQMNQHFYTPEQLDNLDPPRRSERRGTAGRQCSDFRHELLCPRSPDGTGRGSVFPL